MPRNTLAIIAIAIAVAAAVLFAGRTPSVSVAIPAEPTPKTSLQAVQVTAVREGVLSTVRSATGTLEAATDAQISSGLGGLVTGVKRREGDRVQKGETIVLTDDTALRQQLQGARLVLQNAQIQLQAAQRQDLETLAQAKLALKTAQGALVSAQQSYAANQELFTLQGVSQAELNQSRSAVDQAQSALRSAVDGLARAQRSSQEGIAQLRVGVEQAKNQMAQLERQIAQTRIQAPFSGTLVEQKAEIGVTLAPGSPVFRLVDHQSLLVKFSITSADAALLPLGSQVAVQVGNLRYQAKVSRSPGAPTNRLVPLQARFLQYTKDFAIGSVVVVSYSLQLAKGFLVPSGAVQTEGSSNFVLVVKGDKVARVAVQTLGEAGGRSAVSGLSSASRLIFPVPAGLQVGNKVQVLGGN
jgi:HlyD family secretion protein